MSSREPCCAMATSAGWWFAAVLMDAMRYEPSGRPPPTVAVRTPFCAGELRPWKNANVDGSVGVVWSSAVSFSMTMCEWPVMSPDESTVCGAAKNVSSGFVKKPVFRWLIAIWTVKFWFAAIVWPFFGNTNLADGMFVLAAMMPIGAGLHEPVLICWPLVIGSWGTVAQKLMKLFCDVADATWPAVALAWPLFAKPVAMTEDRSAGRT